MKSQHLHSVHVANHTGRLMLSFRFPDVDASEYFTPGESITVTLLKLERLRMSLQQQARIRPPEGLGS